VNDFEDQLRAALRPVEAPPAFAGRLAQRVHTAETAPRRRNAHAIPWAAVAAGLALIFGGLEYRHYQRGVEARENLIQALQITASAVEFTKQSLKTYQETP
jgi:hypothetical protein